MKRKRWTPDSSHQAMRLALASASLLSLTAAPSLAAGRPDATPSTSGVYVTILSPNPGTALVAGKQVEISAYYESSYGISSLDLYIDGKRLATQRLASPENKGEISFMVDPGTLKPGAHTIVIRATATDAEVASARTSLNMPGAGIDAGEADSGALKIQLPKSDAPSIGKDGGSDSIKSGDGSDSASDGPNIEIASPGPESTVSGIVRIKVNAIDPSGKSPYVSLFVDHAFKTLRNFPPYTFDWDTTRLSNGAHTVEVWGYNDSQKVGHAAPLRVIVNNPSGRTFERTDLSDAAPSKLTPAGPPPRPNRAIRRATTPKATAVAIKPAQAKSAARRQARNVTPAQRHLALLKAAQRQQSSHAGLPLIAHTVKQAIAGLIAKADNLASINSDAGPLGAASVDETLIAPVVHERSAAEAIAMANRDAQASNHFDITSEIVHRADPEKIPHLKQARGERPAIASAGSLSDEFVQVASKLDKIASAEIGDMDTSDISTALIAPEVRERSESAIAAAAIRDASPRSPVGRGQMARPLSAEALSTIMAHAPMTLAQIASANISSDSTVIVGQDQAIAPKVNIERLTTRAVTAPGVARHRVNLGRLTPREMGHLTGSYQIVLDDQRVELSQPLQDRGSVLFAPLRQIFENEGAALDWDKTTRQVRATTPDREIVLTIGSKKAVVNNRAVTLSGAPYLYNSRTMLPLDFFPTAMDAKVSYDAASGHLIIQSK